MGALSRRLWRRGSEGGQVHEHSIINRPAHFSQPGKGHAGKLRPSVCQAGLMKTEMGCSECVSSEVTSPAQPKWKEDEAAEKQGSVGDSVSLRYKERGQVGSISPAQ